MLKRPDEHKPEEKPNEKKEDEPAKKEEINEAKEESENIPIENPSIKQFATIPELTEKDFEGLDVNQLTKLQMQVWKYIFYGLNLNLLFYFRFYARKCS